MRPGAIMVTLSAFPGCSDTLAEAVVPRPRGGDQPPPLEHQLLLPGGPGGNGGSSSSPPPSAAAAPWPPSAASAPPAASKQEGHQLYSEAKLWFAVSGGWRAPPDRAAAAGGGSGGGGSSGSSSSSGGGGGGGAAAAAAECARRLAGKEGQRLLSTDAHDADVEAVWRRGEARPEAAALRFMLAARRAAWTRHVTPKRTATRKRGAGGAGGGGAATGAGAPAAEEEDEAAPPPPFDNYDDCTQCSRKDREDAMLLCDGCPATWHAHCLTPPLPRVPADPWWFCPACTHERASRKGLARLGDRAFARLRCAEYVEEQLREARAVQARLQAAREREQAKAARAAAEAAAEAAARARPCRFTTRDCVTRRAMPGGGHYRVLAAPALCADGQPRWDKQLQCWCVDVCHVDYLGQWPETLPEAELVLFDESCMGRGARRARAAGAAS